MKCVSRCIIRGNKATCKQVRPVNYFVGGPRGRVVKVADFSALNHSIISPLWERTSLGARVTCGTSQVLLAVVSGVFFPGYSGFRPTYRLVRLDMSEKA